MRVMSGMDGDLARRRGYGMYDYHDMIHPLDDAGIENIECKSYQLQVLIPRYYKSSKHSRSRIASFHLMYIHQTMAIQPNKSTSTP